MALTLMNDVIFIGSYYIVSSKNGSSQQGGKGNTIDISWSGGWTLPKSFALYEATAKTKTKRPVRTEINLTLWR